MARRRVQVMLGGAALVAAFVACGDPATPTSSDVPLAGNALQPLRQDLTWTYQSANADPSDPNEIDRYVVAVVGTETIGTEPAWLIESYAGTSFASRLVVVDRGGDVWVIAIDAIENGAWKRSTLPNAQLYQPLPGARTWTSDFTGGPEVWSFRGEWKQRSSGLPAVLGQNRPGGLVGGDLTFRGGGAASREIDTFAEGIGLASITSLFDGGGRRYD